MAAARRRHLRQRLAAGEIVALAAWLAIGSGASSGG